MRTDRVCFLCETEGGSRENYQDQFRCSLCPTLCLELGTHLLEHIGGHILFDQRVQDVESPCGLCLRGGRTCSIRLRKSSNGTVIVDLSNSRCPNLYKISLRHAARSSKTSPCTNIPITCNYCPPSSDAVWQYNMAAHMRQVHSNLFGTVAPAYTISDEEREAMRSKYLAKPRTSKKTRRNMMSALTISEEHTSRIPGLGVQ